MFTTGHQLTKEEPLKRKCATASLLFFACILTLMLGPAFAYAEEENGENGDFANSWRYDNGELISSDQGAIPEGDDISTLSAEKNAEGYTVFNWFDHFSRGYCSGDGAKKVIDVSYHNGTIDWAKVKAAGVDYAIIRCGYGQDQRDQDDTQWINNVKGCQANGIPFGVYLYSYATSTSRAAGEGQHALTCLKQAGLSPNDVALPVYYDLEENSLRDKDQAAFAKAFFAPLENAGYKTGTYASLSWWNEYLTDSCFNQRAKWVAAYNASIGLTYSGFSDFENTDGMWQFSDYGLVPGVSGRCDLDYTYMSASSDRWVQSGSRWWYRHSDGSYTTNNWEYINSLWYHFDPEGWMQTGWLKDGETWFYLSGSGAMATGWLDLGGTWYHLNSSGAMETGWIKLGGSWYYLDANGAMQTGWAKIDDARYYFSSSGAMQTGWLKSGSTWYYLSGSGVMQTGWYMAGSSWYYSSESGAMQTGWLKDGETWYYLSGSGAMATGWLDLGGTWYHLNSSGAMETGWIKLGGSWYYLDANGAMQTGWYMADEDNWYYSNSDGAMRYSTWIGDYYLLGDGCMATDQWVGPYYVGADGKWQRL